MATDLKSVEAFKFIFEASDMQKLLDAKPGKIVCVVSIEDTITSDGKKVGALKIIARGPHIESVGGPEISGCPHPPCDE